MKNVIAALTPKEPNAQSGPATAKTAIKTSPETAGTAKVAFGIKLAAISTEASAERIPQKVIFTLFFSSTVLNPRPYIHSSSQRI